MVGIVFNGVDGGNESLGVRVMARGNGRIAEMGQKKLFVARYRAKQRWREGKREIVGMGWDVVDRAMRSEVVNRGVGKVKRVKEGAVVSNDDKWVWAFVFIAVFVILVGGLIIRNL